MAVSQSLVLTESNTNINDNTSKVRILWTSTQTGESHNLTPRTAYYYISINGGAETTYSRAYTLHKQTTDTILDLTLTVPHLSDGSGSIRVRTWMNTNISAGIVEKSASLTLAAIPQATTLDSIACSTAYFDGVITYKYTPKNANFYTRCAVLLNNNGTYTRLRDIDLGTGAATQQTRTFTFTKSELDTIYAAMPQETEAVLQLELRTHSSATYNDSTTVGGWSMSTISLIIPQKIVPSIQLSVEPVSNNAWVKSKNLYITGYSGLKASVIAEPSQGAKQIDDITITAPNTVHAQQLIIDKLTTAGTQSISAKVVDSRGRSNSATKQINVLPYGQPMVTKLLAERGTYDGGWTGSDEGPDLRIVFVATTTLADHGNTYDAKISLDGTILTPDYGNTTGLTSGATQTIYLFDVDGETSHELMLIVTDRVGEIGNLPTTIPTIDVTLEFKSNGRGIGIGKTAEEDDLLDIDWNARIHGNLDMRGGITQDGAPFASQVDISRTAALSSMTIKKANVIYFGGSPILVQLELTFGATVPKYTGLFAESGLISGLPANQVVRDSTNTYELELRGTLIQTLSTIPAGTYTFSCVLPVASQPDILEAQGTSGVWTFRKWKSGIAECWGTPSIQSGAWNGSSNLYYTTKSVSLPSGLFTGSPNVMLTVREAGGAAVTPATTVPSAGSFSATFVRFYGGTDDVLLTLAAYAIGRWK